MRISIITVVKNGMPYLKDAIKSFEMQKYKDKELLIVYAKSNDGTEKYLKNLLKKNYILIKDNKNNRYAAINAGIKKSTGHVIGLLHSDDIFFNKETLSNICKYIKTRNCDIVYGGIYFSERNNLKKIKRIWKPYNLKKNNIISGNVPPHVGMFIKKNVFKKIGYYSEKYIISADYDLILRILISKRFKVESTNRFHNIMRLGGDSTNMINFFCKLKEDYKIIKKHNLSIFILFIKILSKIFQIKKKNINNIYLNQFN
jgi:glycosyltransferase involved in cell wall biosynthesis